MSGGTTMSGTTAKRRYDTVSREARLTPSRTSASYATLKLLVGGLREILAGGELGELGRVLDFGCAKRDYESLFTATCSEYVGCDLPGNPDADLVLGEDGSVPLADGSVDTVLSLQVLEHVGDPRLYLAEARRVLPPGGRMLLSTHGIWRHHPDPRDLWRWTGEGLREELERAGFEVTHLRGLVGPAGTAVQLWQNATAGSFPSFLRKPYFALLQSLILLVEGRHRRRLEDCSVLVAVARKTDSVEGRD